MLADLARLLTIGMLIALLLGACARAKRGDTLYRVRAESREEERAIQGQLWRVQRAVSEIRAAYDLDSLGIEVTVAPLSGLGQTTPALSGIAQIRAARVVVSKQLLLDNHPDLDDILLGLMAHEFAHALHYSRLSRGDLVELGLRYDRMLTNPHGSARPSIRAYERLTDMHVIALGYGEALIHQKRASEANLAANDPPQVWDFYLTEAEIRAMMDDRELLRTEIDAAIRVIKLPSFRRVKLSSLIDADGELRPPPPSIETLEIDAGQ